jgi:hypothetical protein
MPGANDDLFTNLSLCFMLFAPACAARCSHAFCRGSPATPWLLASDIFILNFVEDVGGEDCTFDADGREFHVKSSSTHR